MIILKNASEIEGVNYKNMDFLLKIATNNPHRERLENAITDLLHFVEAGAVYVSCNDVQNLVVITFILKQDCGQYAENVPEMLDKIIKLYPDFIFKFIDSKWAAYGFKKCKPYFVQHCTLKELVYFEPGANVFYPNKNVASRLIKKAKKRFHLDIEAAVVSFRNVSIFLRNKKNVEAAFTLHQTLRYIYICASEFLTPEFISSTCLLMHYNYIIDFAPTLKKILDKDIEEDKEIFIMLNDAYNRVVQNQISEPIDSALIAKAKTKVELMQREITSLFAEYTSLCKEKGRELSRQKFLGKSIFNDKIRSNYIVDDALNQISNVISETFKIRSIYCFGYATIHETRNKTKKGNYSDNLPRYHFYLLVVNLETFENALIQNLIRTKFEGRYKVTVLNHSSDYVRKKNKNQQYFFDKIIANGLLIYNNPLYVVYAKNAIVKRDLEFSKKYAENRILIAQQHFSLAQNCFNDDSAMIKKVLYRKTIEQISIGLIYLYLGYYSAKCSLNYLFSLLKYTKEVELPFNLKDEKEKALYMFMTQNPEVSEQNILQNEILEYNKLLEQKCRAYLKYGIQLAESKLGKLEKEGM